MADSQYTKTYQFEVLTPAGQVASGQVASVVFPALDGAFGVLAGHAPMVVAIGAGTLTVRPQRGRTRQYFISGGLANVRAGALTMLAEECIPHEEVNLESAFAEMARARAMPTATPQQRELRDKMLLFASAKFRIAREYDMHRHVRSYAGGARQAR